MARFPKEEQIKLVSASWTYQKPLTADDMKDIYSYKLNNPQKTIDDCISDVFHVNHKSEPIQIFISGLKETIYENLKKESEKKNIPLKDFTKEVFSRHFSEDSIINVNPRSTFIRITFSKKGKIEFEELVKKQTKVSRNDFVNYIFTEEGF